jgi:hypothetical protein
LFGQKTAVVEGLRQAASKNNNIRKSKAWNMQVTKVVLIVDCISSLHFDTESSAPE